MLLVGLLVVLLVLQTSEAKALAECKDVKMELYFLVDISKSIEKNELRIINRALKHITRLLDIAPEKTRVGVIVFAKGADKTIDLTKYSSFTEMASVDLVIRQKTIVGTNTNIGLDLALKCLEKEGRPGVPRVILVISDGKSSSPVNTKIAADKINNGDYTNIVVMTLGIGDGIHLDELEYIATGKGDQNTFLVGSFTEIDVMKKEIAAAICTAPLQPRDTEICPRFCLTYGTVTGQRVPGKTTTFKCDPGREVEGPKTATCQADGTWTNAKPYCAYVRKCHWKVGINAGDVDRIDGDKHNLPGGKTKFNCSTGNELRGHKELKCGENGQWDYDHPKCIETRCYTFNYLANGRVVNIGLLKGQQVKFECNPGFKMVGRDTLTCSDDQKWDGDMPECIENKCRTITEMNHGTIRGSSNNHHGAAKTFACNKGYRLEGASDIKCENGQWSAAIPRCIFSECKWIPFQRFGKIKRVMDSNGNVIEMDFFCNDGYKLYGSKTLKCEKTSKGYYKWDYYVPTCREWQCKPITTWYKGTVLDYSLYRMIGSTFKVTCDTGYKLSDPTANTSTCGANRRWSTYPYCRRDSSVHYTTFENECRDVVDISHGRCTGPKTVGGVKTCTCEQGYVLSGASRLECKNNHAWDNDVPRCIPTYCSQLAGIYAGTSVGKGFYPGDSVKYSCFDGYKLKGSDTLTCKDDGKWDNAPPKCERSFCSNLFGIDDGTVIGTGNSKSSKREIICDNGYKLDGSAKLRCKDGEWIPASEPYRQPICKRNQCTPIVYHDDCDIKGTDYTVGATLKFVCHPEFTLIGPEVITCQDNLEWTDDSRCIRVICKTIHGLSRGRVHGYSNLPNSRIHFECDPGYTLFTPGSKSPQPILTCRHSEDHTIALWDYPIPSCVPKVECDTLCIHKGHVQYKNRYPGTKAYFSCEENYVLEGVEKSKCDESGKWSAAPPKCQPLVTTECSKASQDVWVLVDKSASTRPRQFQLVRDLVKRMIDQYSVPVTKIGLMVYDADATVDTNLDDYKTKTELLARNILRRNEKNRVSVRNLHKAFDLVVKPTLWSNQVHRKVIVIMNGPPSDMTEALRSFQEVKNKKIKVFVVGLGKTISPKQMEQFTSDGRKDHMLKVKNYNKLRKKVSPRFFVKETCIN